ncbi:vWA domain-containing protein [Litoreibacter roseus]|uniref:VWFA domain-containing protein n=1 Tax=Litoreibacter roseus TaxID=2601869 RepID=A0A6N6JD62_9RHOB|nr:vWA domain-containing protein [Litoreibacter roseus]GFE64095.1 hypothetical protein KIN_11690 [Litoreibacter roseus]
MIRSVCFALLMACAAPAVGQDRPLLMDGKSQLYERVLVRDRVPARDGPNGAPGEEVAPLKPLYVYARDGDWVHVAPRDEGGGQFWLPSDAVVSWNQNIVVTFEASSNVDRVLFFSDLDGLYDVVEAEDPGPGAAALREAAKAAESGGPASETIVALGPREQVDQRQNLYVMPILEAEEAIFENGALVNLLKVAVARANTGDRQATPKVDAPIGAPDRFRENFKAGIVFVVDTTISMEPYIRGTRAALQEIYQNVAQSAAGDVVSFGLIGYRDSLTAAPGLEYDVRTFVTLQDGSDLQSFLNGIDQMTEAKSSSRNFREDSYAGVEHAIRALDWSGFGSKLIVLVTDAGPREAGDELSSTKLSAAGLNTVVKERIGAAIAVLHLRTDKGAQDHDRAEQAYRDLSREPNQASLYFGVENSDPAEYKRVAQNLGQLIVDQVVSFRKGTEPEDFPKSAPNSEFARALSSAGRTMQLAYLGREQGTEAPDVFEAYVADRDFDRTGLKPLSIRLLLTKSELSDLDEALKIIIEQQEENILNPTEFFSQVLGAAADMSRRPDEVSRRSDLSLAEAVSISEYLEGLPYQSRIMSITEEDWIKMSFSEQITVTNELYEKLERYRRYNEATDQWVDYLGTGAQAENLLYPMQLNDLP